MSEERIYLVASSCFLLLTKGCHRSHCLALMNYIIASSKIFLANEDKLMPHRPIFYLRPKLRMGGQPQEWNSLWHLFWWVQEMSTNALFCLIKQMRNLALLESSMTTMVVLTHSLACRDRTIQSHVSLPRHINSTIHLTSYSLGLLRISRTHRMRGALNAASRKDMTGGL